MLQGGAGEDAYFAPDSSPGTFLVASAKEYYTQHFAPHAYAQWVHDRLQWQLHQTLMATGNRLGQLVVDQSRLFRNKYGARTADHAQTQYVISTPAPASPTTKPCSPFFVDEANVSTACVPQS